MRFKLIVTVSRTDLTDRIVDSAKAKGAPGATILASRGTGVHEAKTFFGLTLETQRDVILFLVEERLVEGILRVVEDACGFKEPGTGIAFVLDVEQVAGLQSQIPLFENKGKKR